MTTSARKCTACQQWVPVHLVENDRHPTPAGYCGPVAPLVVHTDPVIMEQIGVIAPKPNPAAPSTITWHGNMDPPVGPTDAYVAATAQLQADLAAQPDCTSCDGRGWWRETTGYVSRDMAADAGDPALEGQPIVAQIPCTVCGGSGKAE